MSRAHRSGETGRALHLAGPDLGRQHHHRQSGAADPGRHHLGGRSPEGGQEQHGEGRQPPSRRAFARCVFVSTRRSTRSTSSWWWASWRTTRRPSAPSAGFRAFVSALRAEETSHLAALDTASDEERGNAIIDEIKEQVSAAVDSAVRANLTGSDKFEVFVRTLDPDDTLGAGFVARYNAEIVSGPMSVAIEQTGRLKPPLPPVPTRSRFEIRGRLQVQPVVIDPCQKQVQAVNDAQAVVTAIYGADRGAAGPADRRRRRRRIGSPGRRRATHQAATRGRTPSRGGST